jgi:hypothetical protein
MAASKKGGGAYKAPARDYDSLLLRSAESLGRMIGALQRQLDTVSKRLGSADGDGDGHHSGDGNGRRSPDGVVKPAPKTRKKTSGRRPKVSAGARKHAATKSKSARKPTRPR